MELRSIYEVKSFELVNQEIRASIIFNKGHRVFEGHFPDNPIVPGVVQIQVMIDLLEKILQKKVFLNRAKSIKFLNVINPFEVDEILFEIMYEQQPESSFKVKCIVKSESRVYMKYSGNAVIRFEE